ncbi:MAG: nucleoside-diphosphate sugar epimerase/dehydratase [Planctomycetota bacterium]|nr:nucleoside-diphosphate sugar epimerase/dehydratase [Planctomycetota bacterium]
MIAPLHQPLSRLGKRGGTARLFLHIALLAVGHAVLFCLIYALAFELRFGFEVELRSLTVFVSSLPVVVGAKLLIFYATGHFHGWWRHVTFSDLTALARASLAALLALVAIDHFFLDYQIPRAILPLDCCLGVLVLGTLRSSWRLLAEGRASLGGTRSAALLVGADHAAGRLAHDIHSHPDSPYRVRGLIATNGETVGARLGGIPVVGRLDDLPGAAVRRGVQSLLVTAGSIPGSRLRSLLGRCEKSGLAVKIIPSARDRLSGVDHLPVRDIHIDDLLRRDPVQLDDTAICDLVRDRRVLVTGAGGSIGSEICRQLLRFDPAELILLGRGENRIFQLEREFRQIDAPVKLVPMIADVTCAKRIRQVFEKRRPEVVFHAAAHKHVPLMEANPGEAIRNNVLGTRIVADLADEYDVLSFVLVSTDKAVHPTSIMGVSKHLAERYVHALSQESSTRLVVTRFGNVLGSNGSVVPIFQEQIRRGGPITITDERMTRFFMSIPEASQLVLQAAAMGQGGEIFVLDMGEPVRIVDLARDLVRLSGLPEDSIDIVFTGVRPGEKLYEELYFSAETTLPTPHPKLRAAFHRPYRLAEVQEEVADLESLLDAPEEIIRRRLKQLVPEFQGKAETGTRKAESGTLAGPKARVESVVVRG